MMPVARMSSGVLGMAAIVKGLRTRGRWLVACLMRWQLEWSFCKSVLRLPRLIAIKYTKSTNNPSLRTPKRDEEHNPTCQQFELSSRFCCALEAACRYAK
jgi:hypothetical protein